jgi:NADP-reducing hydrogenase subunit HndD
LLMDVREGRKELHFIEVMTCPGGCVNGGGQPIDADTDKVRARLKGLYKLDSKAASRTSHSNESVQRLYKEFLGKPLGEKSHHLLHTSYVERGDVVK